MWGGERGKVESFAACGRKRPKAAVHPKIRQLCHEGQLQRAPVTLSARIDEGEGAVSRGLWFRIPRLQAPASPRTATVAVVVDHVRRSTAASLPRTQCSTKAQPPFDSHGRARSNRARTRLPGASAGRCRAYPAVQAGGGGNESLRREEYVGLPVPVLYFVSAPRSYSGSVAHETRYPLVTSTDRLPRSRQPTRYHGLAYERGFPPVTLQRAL